MINLFYRTGSMRDFLFKYFRGKKNRMALCKGRDHPPRVFGPAFDGVKAAAEHRGIQIQPPFRFHFCVSGMSGRLVKIAKRNRPYIPHKKYNA